MGARTRKTAEEVVSKQSGPKVTAVHLSAKMSENVSNLMLGILI